MAQYVEVQGNVIEFPDGMSAPDIEKAIRANFASIKPAAAASVGKEINSIPRQLGLTARYGMEGLANMAQIGTEPLRYLQDAITPDRTDGKPKSMPLGAVATQFADWLGLPSPQGANERVVGDAARMVVGAGGLGAASRVASRAVPAMAEYVAPQANRVAQWAADAANASRTIPQALSANLGQQTAAAAGAGMAGGASREAGGGAGMQGVAAFGGGVLAGLVPGMAGSAITAARSAFNKMTPQQMDAQISAVLNRAGVDYSQVPERARQAMRAEMAGALQAGKELDPQAVARMADFVKVGAVPTRGMVSQNPVQITREQNLAKIGANTADETLNGLPLIQNRNNATLIRNLNDQGAARGSTQAAGEQVNATILGRQASLRGEETAAWGAARGTPGYRQPIEARVISDINQALGDEGQMAFLNPQISKYMEAFQTGQQPFTPQAYRNLQSMLSNELSRGGNEAAAAGTARRILEAAELRPITNPRGVDFGNVPVTADVAARLRGMDAQPRQAIDAVNQARQATRAAYAYEDSSPLVRSVLSDGAAGDPARIAQRFVVGGTANEAATLAQEVGAAGRGPIRDAIVAHLKEKAVGGASDEVGKFSQSAYNKALRDIGDRKLSLFFSPEEVGQLRAVGRVASYMQVQPVGSAVNNSNSATTLMGRGYDALKGLAGKVPFGKAMLLDPVQNIEISMRNRAALNVAPGLLAQQQQAPLAQGLLLPGLAMGGLLAGPRP